MLEVSPFGIVRGRIPVHSKEPVVDGGQNNQGAGVQKYGAPDETKTDVPEVRARRNGRQRGRSAGGMHTSQSRYHDQRQPYRTSRGEYGNGNHFCTHHPNKSLNGMTVHERPMLG